MALSSDNPDPAQGVSNLAAKVAHELNNPLDAVLRFVALAQRKAKTGNYGDIDRHLADAQFGLERMAEILRDLMDIGRDTHDLLARPQLLPLSDLLAAAMRTLGAQAEQKQIRILCHNHLPATSPAKFDLRVSQILANLLKNALDAAPAHSAIDITIEHASAIDHLVITMTDAGPGIDPQRLPQLFTPFVTTKPKGAGHGLGLAISRELTISLNGSLAVENRTDTRGTRAVLTLPLKSASNQPPTPTK